MKRAYVLGVIVISGALATAAAQLSAQQPPAGAPPAGAPGQGRPGGPPGAPPGGARGGGGGGVEAAKKIADNLFWVPGAGGNTAIFVTGNGVVLVDTKLANNGQAILDQVKSVTDKPVTHIINTHTHGDHNGSNVFFPATVEIVTQENTAKNMQKMPAFQEAANKHGVPDRTYQDKMTLLSGDGNFEDPAGNDLDGEATWPLPATGSGDGTAGGNFVVNFTAEGPATAAFPALLPLAPGGTLAFANTPQGTAAATQMTGARRSSVMPFPPPPTSHAAHALPMATTDTTAASPPKRTPSTTPLDQELEGVDGLVAPASVSDPMIAPRHHHRRSAESSNGHPHHRRPRSPRQG
jgi:hypothetical protein